MAVKQEWVNNNTLKVTGLINPDGTPTTATSNNIRSTVSQPKTDYGIRDALTSAGYTNIAYDENTKNVSAVKNGQTYGFNTANLKNVDGRLVGDYNTINNIVKGGQTQSRDYGEKNKINIGFDQYGNPMYNGHILDTTRGTNVNGKWYFDKDYLDEMIDIAKPQEYVNPYAEQQQKLLNDLYNYGEFSYDPAKDAALKKAQSDSIKLARQNAYNQGRGNTSWMDYQTQKVANDLAYQYEDKAYQKWLDNRNYLASLYGLTNEAEAAERGIFSLNNDIRNNERNYAADQEYRARGLASNDRDFNENVRQYEQNFAETVRNNLWNQDYTERQAAEQNMLAWAQHKLNGMQYVSAQQAQDINTALQIWAQYGYVPNEWAANILGLPVGTSTLDAQQIQANIKK